MSLTRPLAGSVLIAALVATLLAPPQTAQGADTKTNNVRYLYYNVCGKYTVSQQWLHWKDADGKNRKKKFTKSMDKFDYACWDLTKFDQIPEGAEVWISIGIDLGEKESCRKKHNKFYKKSDSTDKILYSTKGETLTNNRCKVDSWCDDEWLPNPPCKSHHKHGTDMEF
jgi:hypothetical protein